MERNYNCYCCQFWWDNQHYHKRNNPLLPIQTACQGVFWQRSKPISTCCLTYQHTILVDSNGWPSYLCAFVTTLGDSLTLCDKRLKGPDDIFCLHFCLYMSE